MQDDLNPALNFENSPKAKHLTDPPLGRFLGSALNLDSTDPANARVQTKNIALRWNSPSIARK